MLASNALGELNNFDSNELSVEELVESTNDLCSGDWIGVISNPRNKYVEKDQVYRDKATLKAIMETYAISHRFQFKSTRSNAIR